MHLGGIILCGGRSSRMGLPKWSLPFGPETMLERIVRLLGKVCPTLVVVAAADQSLVKLPVGVIVTRDRREGRGPLEAISAGLSALPEDVEAAYVTSCDVPLLAPAFVRRMFELLEDYSAAVPVSDGYLHPLSTVYRRSLLPVIDELLANDRLRPSLLFDVVSTRHVAPRELVEVDPELNTLKNLNHPADYLEALAQSGFKAPSEVLSKLTGGLGE
jgi:molybdopterin-guanine dinucleotide biosynthesis protein A